MLGIKFCHSFLNTFFISTGVEVLVYIQTLYTVKYFVVKQSDKIIVFVRITFKIILLLYTCIDVITFCFSIQSSSSSNTLEGILNTLTHDPIGNFAHSAASVIEGIGHGVEHVAHEISHGVHHIAHEIHRMFKINCFLLLLNVHLK